MKKWFLLVALALVAGAQLTNAPQPYGYVWDPALRQWRMDPVQGMTEQVSASGVHTLVVPPGATGPAGVAGAQGPAGTPGAAGPVYSFGGGFVTTTPAGGPTTVALDTAYVLYRGGPVPTGPGPCSVQAGTGALLVDPGGQWLYLCVPTADGTGFQWTRFGGGQTNWVAGQ